MNQKDRRYPVVVLAALAVIALALVAGEYAPTPEPPAVPMGWRYDDPPENHPILAAWPRYGAPGYWDYYAVVRVGDEWLADVPEGELTQSIAAYPPVCWTEQP